MLVNAASLYVAVLVLASKDDSEEMVAMGLATWVVGSLMRVSGRSPE